MALVVAEDDGLAIRFVRWDPMHVAVSPADVADAYREAVLDSLTEFQTPGGVAIED